MNSYTITGISQETKTVRVSYIYNDHSLDDTFQCDVSSVDEIRAVATKGFFRFSQEMDKLDASKPPPLPQEVQDLIGALVEIK